MKALVTGFEPFGGESVNPALEALQLLPPRLGALTLATRLLPAVFGQPIDRPIVADGPPAYFATLPIKAAAAALREAGLPAIVSNTAGTFVCNHVFYGLMHLAASRRLDLRGGF